jgi:hypothetical protein
LTRFLVLLGVGAALVGAIALVLVLAGGDAFLFMIANAVIALGLLLLGGGSALGADKRRPPGRARVSAARWVGPTDPEHLAAQERRYEPDPDAVVDERMAVFAEMNWMLPVATAPAIATIVSLVWFV